MNHVASIAQRLSLRKPQELSLKVLADVCGVVPPRKGHDLPAALAAVRQLYPGVTDFEREFPSVCFALATGVGKTRLMGAFAAYLYLAHGVRNVFVLAPNLTVYQKLITDFTPNTPKYVFRGLSEFAVRPPNVVTGDTFEQLAGAGLFTDPDDLTVNIFNISKINSEVRGGKAPRFKRMREALGSSYFDHLAGRPDLVLLMDESHRYRASAGVRAINELRPVLGLELTATPFVETAKGPVWFKNVGYEYKLAEALADGFVKEPAVVTRKDFDPAAFSAEELERLKLEDGLRLHEQVKLELATYAANTGQPRVKPFVLVVARDTTHAAELVERVGGLFGGRYAGKVIQVDSSTTSKEEETVGKLLSVERADDKTEVVVHVNMLKEGWDVTNLYTIVPLRAANARTLIEQTIGRGLRLPYGKRTGVEAVDRLNIVAHDKFQEVVEEARKPGSVLRQIKTLVLDPAEYETPAVAEVARPTLAAVLGLEPSAGGPAPLFTAPADKELARLTLDAVNDLARRPAEVPGLAALSGAEVQAKLVAAVTETFRRHQGALPGMEGPDVAAVVAATTAALTRGLIAIPRITVVPRGEVRGGYEPFALDLTPFGLNPPSDDLWVQYLRTDEGTAVGLTGPAADDTPLADYVVRGLVDFDDVNYEDCADLLYDLAGQMVAHLLGRMTEAEARRTLRFYQKPVAEQVHRQMQPHYREAASGGYEATVTAGFTPLRPSHVTRVGEVRDFRRPVPAKQDIGKYLFGGFGRCLYDVQKFQSDPERVLAVVLDRDADKWFRPARGQFAIDWRAGAEAGDYQPDFVAEVADAVYMLETKRADQMADPVVLAKRAAAEEYCRHATAHAAGHGGKPWRYALIPHTAVAENKTLAGLVAEYCLRAG